MSLIKNTTTAERQRQCVFADNFENLASVIDNGGQAVGAPSFENGVTLDGTSDSVLYNNIGHISSRNFSAVIKFIPEFDPDEDQLRYFYGSTAGYTIFKHNNASNNIMRIVIDGIIIADIAEATYAPAWNTGELNTLIVSSKSGDTDAWLNETKILSNDVSGWTASEFGTFYLGASNVGTNPFKGEIKSIKLFVAKLSGDEATDYLTETTYSYRNSEVIDLPMLLEDHDAANTKTLDRSGYDNHASFGAGAAEPAKNTDRPGYNFDGTDDVMTITSSVSNTFGDGSTDSPFSISYWAKMVDCSGFFGFIKRDGNTVKEYQLGVAANDQMYFVLHDQSAAALIGRTSNYDLKENEGQWTHIVGTYDGSASSAGMQFYINGVKRDKQNNNSGVYVAMENTGTPIVLGQLFTNYAEGDMAFIKLFNTELTAMQIIDLYQREQQKLTNI
jgi:hypothetical protein